MIAIVTNSTIAIKKKYVEKSFIICFLVESLIDQTNIVISDMTTKKETNSYFTPSTTANLLKHEHYIS